MGVINQLDSSVYNRISAGEVVERPFSVVKEIVENAIDAGATRIGIDVSEGGRESICVTDNGIGLDRDDMQIAFLPHATSKVKNLHDLDNISTLGFRGEALASIASVAIVEMRSKQADCDCGYFIKLEGGKIIEEKPINMADGTIISVNNLFYNTPARAKFLKKSKAEEHDISKLVIDMILANPYIAFTYTAVGKNIYTSTGRGLEDAVYSVYPKDITNNLLAVNYKTDEYRISGYISSPKYTKPTRAYQTTIINGRIVNNSTVTAAVSQAYGESLMRRNFPVFIIDIVMPFDSLDVNVTPNKTDVRFVDQRTIFSKVFRAVKDTLDKEQNIFTLSPETEKTNDYDARKYFASNYLKQNYKELLSDNVAAADNGCNALNKVADDKKSDNLCDDVKTVAPGVALHKFNAVNELKNSVNDANKIIDTNDVEKEKLIEGESNNNNQNIQNFSDAIMQLSSERSKNLHRDNIFNSLNDSSEPPAEIRVEQVSMDDARYNHEIKIIGQLFKTYLLVSDGVSAYIIDQHAAHERMIYDKLTKEIDNNYIASQMLLVPQIVDLNPADAEFLSEIIDDLQAIGLEIEEFGNCSYKITAVPVVFGGFNFNNYIDEILKSKRSLQQIKIKNLMRDKLAITACKAAIKAGDELTESEIAALIKMMQSDMPLQCPHGRPAIIRVERKDIDKIFKRIL